MKGKRPMRGHLPLLLLGLGLPACTALFPFTQAGTDGGGPPDGGADGGGPSDGGADAGADGGADGGVDGGACVDGPRIVAHRETSASAVALVGDFAYVGLWSAGIQVFEVANPAAPWPCGAAKIDGDGDVTSIRTIYGHLYAAKDTAGLWELSNAGSPCSPVVDLIAPEHAIDMIECGDELCGAAMEDGVVRWTSSWEYLDHESLPDYRGAYRLAMLGEHLLIATDWDDLVLLNVDSLEPLVFDVGERAADVQVVGTRIYVATGETGLAVFGGASLPDLRLLGRALPEPDRGAEDLAVDEPWAFVCTGNDPERWVEVFDVSDPTDPTRRWTVDLGHDCQGIVLGPTHAFVAADDQFIVIDRRCAR